jgi:hypothetical protein
MVTKILKFNEFDSEKIIGTIMKEGKEVDVLDLKDEAKRHIEEAIDLLNRASAELYEIKKMADYVRLEYPQMSDTIVEAVEPLMMELEGYEPKIKNILKLVK